MQDILGGLKRFSSEKWILPWEDGTTTRRWLYTSGYERWICGRGGNLLDQLDVLQSGNTCTLRVKGRLVLGEALDHFDAAVQQALESEHHFLILNLEAMPVIDSSGIGAVVNALVQAKKLGGDAKLVNPSPFATRTFKLMCIHDLFTVFGTEEDAIAACSS